MSKKDKTIEQVEAMQKKAVRFAENVLMDEDKATELESLSPEEYADRKRLRIINPERKTGTMPKQPTRAELQERIEELEEKLDAIADLAGADEEDEEDEEEEQDEDDEYEEVE